MAKPWGRIELDYINHDKFKALNANAMCLWHEGKNYCDVRHTDGLIPMTTAKHFRFYSKKAAAFLLVSAGEKPGAGVPYAPLWDVIEGFGYKMHDYLEHNPSREAVQAAMEKTECLAAARRQQEDESRMVDTQRMQRWRDLKKEKRDARVTPTVTVTAPSPSVTVTPLSRSSYVEVEPRSSTAAKEQQQGGGGSKRPIFTGQRFTVFEWFLDRATQVLGPYLDEFHIDEWFYTLDAQAVASGQVMPQRDGGAWLESQLLAEAKRRGLPIAGGRRLTEDTATMAVAVLAMVKARDGS